jgi:hypothetical protein
LVIDRKKMEGYCSTGQSPQWAVVPVEEDEGKDAYFGLVKAADAFSCSGCLKVLIPRKLSTGSGNRLVWKQWHRL